MIWNRKNMLRQVSEDMTSYCSYPVPLLPNIQIILKMWVIIAGHVVTPNFIKICKSCKQNHMVTI